MLPCNCRSRRNVSRRPTLNDSRSNPNSAEVDIWTVQRILLWTTEHLSRHGSETPRLDAEILLAHARNCPRIQLYTNFDQALTTEERARMRNLVQRRANAEPVAYLVGHREFFGLDFAVTSDVLIPRPETESLVVETLQRLRNIDRPGRVADIGTGSGCIAVTLAVNDPAVVCVAVDQSEPALKVAWQNAETHGVAERVTLRQGDLLAALEPDEEFDVIVSNPPYVRSSEIDRLDATVRLHEPHTALDGGEDGLDFVRRIVADAPNRLVAGGLLLLEIDPGQADDVMHMATADGVFVEADAVHDLTGRKRVIRLQRTV